VEQILFNLVDNACKYAAPGAAEKIIHLDALPGGKFAMLRVRDHGQGISEQGARTLFQPFSKSAHEAAHSAPGVGLGLALCRRLSRSMGGDLRLDRLVKGGACFVLTLPDYPVGPGCQSGVDCLSANSPLPKWPEPRSVNSCPNPLEISERQFTRALPTRSPILRRSRHGNTKLRTW